MAISEEFLKINYAFKKVKKENISLKNYIKDLYSKNQIQNEKMKKLESDIDLLIKEVILLRSKQQQPIVQAPKKEKQIEKTTTIIKKEDRIIGNKASMTAHNEHCPFGKKVNDEHRVLLEDKTDAKKKKYKLCTCLK